MSGLVREYITNFAVFERDPFCPELIGVNTQNLTHLWDAARKHSYESDVALPFWGIVWPGARALARHIIDHAEAFRGRYLLDLACGSGLAAVAAARVGARVVGVDIDPCAVEIAGRLALENNVECVFETCDISSRAFSERAMTFEWIIAGDVFYDTGLAGPAEQVLRRAAAAGIKNLAADPGRTYRPQKRTKVVASMHVPVMKEIEGISLRDVDLLRFEPE